MMAGPWDAPPTEDEKVDPWAAPPKETERVARPSPKSSRPDVGAGETFVNRAVDMLPAGRPAVNAISAGLLRLLGPNGGVRLGARALADGATQVQPAGQSLADTYRRIRDDMAVREAIGSEENPYASAAGSVTGLGLSLLAPLPKFTVGPKAGSLAKLAATGATAAGYGALGALTNGRADLTRGEVGQALTDLAGTEGLAQAKQDFKNGNHWRSMLDFAGAGIPGALGTAGVMSAAAPLISRGAAGALQRIVKPTAEAQILLDEGVPLTLGQMNPKGSFNAVEHAGDHVMGAGPVLEAQKEAAKHAWQQLVMKEGVAPGETAPPPSHNLNEQLAGQYEGFDRAYDKLLRDTPASPVGEFGGKAMPLHEAMIQAAADSDLPYDDAKMAAVKRFLGNTSTKALNEIEKGNPVTAGTLHSIRSSVRKAADLAERSNDSEKAAMLRNAADVVTASLESQLPEDQANLLRATDRAYAQHKTVTDALYRAGLRPEGFTPSNLEQSVKAASSSKAAMARGGGGNLRDLASLGRSVFDAPLPPTGKSALVAGHHGIMVMAPLAAMLNGSDAVRAMASGAPVISTGAGATSAAARAALISSALRRSSPVTPPVEGDDD